MAQNQPYTQYPYYTQPQNIYQQLGKPQPQPHLQNVYQQHQQQPQQQLVHVPQQQYQYPYQHTQQQPQQQPQIQRAPSAHGFQPPQTPFPNASGYAPQQQQIAAPQQQMYQYSQQAPAPAPVPQAPAMYQRPPSQNSRLPTSSFANLAPGQSVPDSLARQLGQIAQNQPNNVNPSTGQLVPASQSLTLRGPSPAISPGPPISPSAVYAQQAQQQNYQQQPFQQSPQPLQGQQQNLQQTPSTMSLVPANRNSVVLPPQRQIMPPSQPQTQAQTQPQVQTQAPHQIQSRNPPPLPPRQLHQPQLQSRDQQQLPQSQSQAGPVTPTKTTTPRRPLPTPGAPRSFPTVNTNNSALVSPPSSSVSNISPTRSNLSQRLSLTTTGQPNSPTKTGPPSPTKASSPNQPNRPLPTPGGGSGGISGIGAGSGGNGLAREGFAGIGTKSSSSRVTGLPVDPSVTSLVAGIQPHKLAILPLPDGSSTPQEEETTPTKKPIQTGLPNPPSMIQAGPSTSAEGSNSINKRRAASPPRFQPGPSTSPSSGPSSPKKELSPLPSSAHKPSPTVSTASGQSSSNQPQSTDSSPTKKSAPVWKRTIPDYPQPAFGYAAGMVKDPWTKSPTSSSPGSTPSQKQSPGQAKPPTSSKPSTSSAPSQAPGKPTKAEIDRQRALVERQHVERQLNAAMAQAYTQAKTRQQVSGMPVSNASYSAYAMYSRSNPNLPQSSSGHTRSGAYDYQDDQDDDADDDEDDEDDKSDSEEDEDDETEETEEESVKRRKKHGKKSSESSVKKKKGLDRGKGKEKEKKVAKKSKSTARSASVPPKKRVARPVSSTSDDETEVTQEETEEEEEEDVRRASRHAKSSSNSSLRFRAKVEKERELLKKKRPQSQYDHRSEEYYDDEDNTPRKRDQQPNRWRGSTQSYHQREPSSGFRQRSPSPPYNTRTSRRVSPPRVSLLKDAQRRTIKLRGGDDEDEYDELRGKGRRDEVESWEHDPRYRSRERVYEDEYSERARRHPANDMSLRRDDYDNHGHVRQEEREIRYSHARAHSWHDSANNAVGPPQPPATARRRKTANLREEQLPTGGRIEREQGSKMFNLGRHGEPPRHSVRDSAPAGGYRSRAHSPPRGYPSQQAESSDPLMSPYQSQPPSPSRPSANSRGGGELVMKFSAMNVNDRERHSSGGGQGGWPADLPRLPRTPGETSNNSGGYFDEHATRGSYSSSGSRASVEPTRARVSGANNSGYGGPTRPVQRDTHDPRHYQNLNTSLDDPPPRSVSPALSQGSSSYDYNNQIQQQPQQITSRRPQSDMYSSAPNNHTMRRPQSIYGNMNSHSQSSARSHPQSHSYNHQIDVPQSTPSPSRPRSINPYEHEELNRTKINNGTPKVQTINIESPAPVGGREKRADLGRMMSDPEDDDFSAPIPRIEANDGYESGSQKMDTPSSQSQRPVIQVNSPQGPVIQINESFSGPSIQVESPRAPMIQINSSSAPAIQIDSPRGPAIDVDHAQGPVNNVETPAGQKSSSPPNIQVFEIPGISVAGPGFDGERSQQQIQQQQARPRPAGSRGGLICGGCDGPIIGRIVSAMGSRWHPQCFKCAVCSQLLEHVSSYEHGGRPYCHLDYHENFAPRCFSCKTAIIEERFISLDDPALGKRTYHEQHFFCAECGDPFLAPSMNNSSRTGELSVQGDGEFESDDVGFTVYKGHPYCEACHVRLRLPKCKKCKKSIRDHEQAVEALGGKWCWGCFVCASCEKPFDNPSFFQRGDKPFCEKCFDIMLRNEV